MLATVTNFTCGFSVQTGKFPARLLDGKNVIFNVYFVIYFVSRVWFSIQSLYFLKTQFGIQLQQFNFDRSLVQKKNHDYQFASICFQNHLLLCFVCFFTFDLVCARPFVWFGVIWFDFWGLVGLVCLFFISFGVVQFGLGFLVQIGEICFVLFCCVLFFGVVRYAFYLVLVWYQSFSQNPDHVWFQTV